MSAADTHQIQLAIILFCMMLHADHPQKMRDVCKVGRPIEIHGQKVGTPIEIYMSVPDKMENHKIQLL
jgi:hypothetical protein